MFITGFLNCVLKFRISLMQTCKQKKRKKILNLLITESRYVREKKLCICSALQLKTTDYWILPRLKRKKNTELNIRMYKNARYWKNNWLLNLLIPESRYVHEKKSWISWLMKSWDYWSTDYWIQTSVKKRKNMLKLLITEPPHVQGGQYWK